MPSKSKLADERDQYSGEEAERRLAAALRGSRVAGHKPMTDIPKKKPKPKK
jgi:hypothetical protein